MQQNKPNIRLFRDFKHLAKLYYSGARFVAFDTETTGLHPDQDNLLEIGAVMFDYNGMIGSPFDELIKPPFGIPSFISELTHITDEMVQDKGDEGSVVPSFLNYLNDRETVLVAHNAPFDVGFVNASLQRLNRPYLPNLVVDTLPLSRWAYPKLALEAEKGQYKLQSLAKRFEINVFQAHRADDDARVCMELFKKIISDTLNQQKDYVIPEKTESKAQQLELF